MKSSFLSLLAISVLLVTLVMGDKPTQHASAASSQKMIGINGTYNVDSYVQDARNLGVQWIRVEQWYDNAVYDSMPATLNRLASKNIRMLPLVNNDYKTGWVTEADKTAWVNALVYTAKTYGSGGSFWQGKTDLGSPVIEVGNETYGKWYPWPNQSYLYPGEYAKMLKQASQAVTLATNGRVKLIASVITDYQDTNDLNGGSAGTWKQWDAEMKKAVPDIANYLGGIAVHPYGDIPAIGIGTSTDQHWSHQILYTLHNRWSTLPVYVTEVGQKGPLVGLDKQAAAVNYYFDELQRNPWQVALFWYNQKDYQAYNPSGDNGWALIDSNDTRTPAWYAYQAKAKAASGTLVGDVDGNGKVDTYDANALLTSYGQSYPAADFNSSGAVDKGDLQLLIDNFRKSI